LMGRLLITARLRRGGFIGFGGNGWLLKRRDSDRGMDADGSGWGSAFVVGGAGP
jgi:hypothetical protein